MKLWSNIISIFGNILELDAGEKNPIEKIISIQLQE
jgi:hypothetical protein